MPRFEGNVSAQPTVNTGGVVNGASYAAPIAPGSYVSIFGTNLGPGDAENYNALNLPLSLGNVTVSFDAAATREPKVTLTASERLTPWMTSRVPPEAGPDLTDSEVTLGGPGW